MRVSLHGWYEDVYIMGARKVVADGRHIGALIDDEDESFLLGPFVHDRPESKALDRGLRHMTGRDPVIPMFDSMTDRDFTEARLYLEALASELDVPLYP